MTRLGYVYVIGAALLAIVISRVVSHLSESPPPPVVGHLDDTSDPRPYPVIVGSPRRDAGPLRSFEVNRTLGTLFIDFAEFGTYRRTEFQFSVPTADPSINCERVTWCVERPCTYERGEECAFDGLPAPPHAPDCRNLFCFNWLLFGSPPPR